MDSRALQALYNMRQQQLGLLSSQLAQTSPLSLTGVEQLLRLVAEGEQDKAEELIKKDNSLLLKVGTVTDLSGREFKQITAFQYALWAWDWHMWTMIRKYLPREAQAQQFQTLDSKGTEHGSRFGIKPLVDAYMVYMQKSDKEWHFDQRADHHWQTVVGGEQRQLPVNILNEFCRPDRSLRSHSPLYGNDVTTKSGMQRRGLFEGSA